MGKCRCHIGIARLPLAAILSFVTLFAATPFNSHAAINFYRAGKRLFHEQSSDSQPTTPVLIDGGVDLYVSDPGDLASARVFSTTPALLSPASPFVLTQYVPGGWISSQYYPSVEVMDIDLPPGDVFGLLIEGGNLGSRLALLPLPETNLFALDIPYFTGNAYTQLNGLDGTQPYTFTWNNFVPAAGANDSVIFFSIYRVSDGQQMIGTGLPGTETSFTMSANTLAPNTMYSAQVDFSSRLNTIDAGFIDADAGTVFDSVTSLFFQTSSGAGAASGTIPEPAATGMAIAGIVAFCVLRRWRAPRGVALAVLPMIVLASTSSVSAAVHFYRVGKTVVYRQTSDAPPSPTPVSIYGGVDMFTPTPSEIGSARVFSTMTMPPSPVPEFVLTEFSPGYWGSSRIYSSVLEMDTELPPGDTFGFLIEGGDLGDQLALLHLPAPDLFSTNVPYCTGNAFSQLNALDPTQDFTVTWDSFVPAGGVSEAPVFFSIYRASDGQQMIGSGLFTSDTDFEIPANTLAPNTAYIAALDFSSRSNVYDAGFGDADASALFDVVTELHFTTAEPLDGDFNRDHVVDAADYVMWRKINGPMPDYNVWKSHFGESLSGAGANVTHAAAPEPASIAAILVASAAHVIVFRRSAPKHIS